MYLVGRALPTIRPKNVIPERRADAVTRAIVEITETRVIPASEVDLQFARDEGEGFESVQEWHEAHERFFERTIEPDTLIDAVRFRVVERL